MSAGVTEVITSTDVGSAFRIGGDSGEPVAVLMAGPPPELEVDDLVIAADELFDDADAFSSDYEGEVAVSADRVEPLQEQAES